MSRFSRAYEAALNAAGLSKSEAAGIAGVHQSTVSRVLADDITASADIVERLLGALNDASDQRHCLREYLLDQTPADYREQISIHFGVAEEQKPHALADSLRRALEAIEDAATEDKDLRRLIIDLARVVAPAPAHPGPDEGSRAQRGRMTEQAAADENPRIHAELRKAEKSQAPRGPKQPAAK